MLPCSSVLLPSDISLALGTVSTSSASSHLPPFRECPVMGTGFYRCQLVPTRGVFRGLSVSFCHCRTSYISCLLCTESPNEVEGHSLPGQAWRTLRGTSSLRPKCPPKCPPNTPQTSQRRASSNPQARHAKAQSSRNHRMVICLAIWLPLLPTPPSRDAEALTPALRSKTFQNLRLSSAARYDVH